jgi:hypothetical protein
MQWTDRNGVKIVCWWLCQVVAIGALSVKVCRLLVWRSFRYQQQYWTVRSPQCFCLVTWPRPLNVDSSPWLRSAHSWCFVIKCASVSVCLLSLSIAEQFKQFSIVFSAGLILTSVKIHLLVLQSCQLLFDFLLINCSSVEVILHLSYSLIAQVSHPHNKKGNAQTLHIFSRVFLWTVNNSSYLEKC